MKQPFRHKWIVIAAAALSLSLLAAALALVLKGTAGPPRSLLETASRPFLRLFSAASEQIRQVSDYFQGISKGTLFSFAIDGNDGGSFTL